MATDVGLLITVILCVSISFWVTFAGKEAKNWKEGAWLFVGLICGSAIFFFLAASETFALVGPPEGQESATFNNLVLAGDFLGIIAVILGLAAILAFILILDSILVAEARARLQESR